MLISLQIIGWIATILGVGMYAPQVIKTLKTKNTKELSKITFSIEAFGAGFWVIYAIAIRPKSYEGWIMNIIILFLLLPILYLIYPKKLFILIIIPLLSLFLISVLILVLNISFTSAIKYIFVSVASVCTGIPFYFQVYKTFKDKNASSLAILTLIIIFIANVLWSAYWISKLILENTPTALIAFISATTTSVSQVPLIYAYWKFKKLN